MAGEVRSRRIDVPGPVTRGFDFRWSPSLNVVDRGVEVLRRVTEGSELTGFRSDPSDYAAVIDGAERLILRPSGMTLLSTTSSQRRRLSAAVQAVVDLIEPGRTTLIMTSSSTLALRIGSYRQVLSTVTRRLWGDAAADRLHVSDFAMLVDVSRPGSQFGAQMEFGIINADEAPYRVSGFASRVGGDRDGLPPPMMDVVTAHRFPPVALFAEIAFTARETLDLSAQSAVAQVQKLAEAAELERQYILAELHQLVTEGPHQ